MLGALASLGVEGPATDAFVVEAAQFSQTGAQRFDISHHVTLITAFAALTPRGKAATAEVRGPLTRPSSRFQLLFAVCCIQSLGYRMLGEG